MPSATVHLETAPLNAATFLFALGPHRVVVGLVRLLADRIENGGWAPPPLDIDLAIRRLPETAYAAKTRRVYAGVLRALNEWLDGRPATDALLARYLGVLFDRGRAPPSAVHLVAAVHYAAKECARAGLRSTDPVGPATKERLERFHREGAERGTGQVRGISWKEAEAMCLTAEAPDNLAGKRDAAIISCASDALLRVAEVSGLNVDDVTFLPDGTARIRIRRSKTDQRGRGAVQYVRPATADRLRRWMSAGRIGSGALFRAVDRWGHVSKRGLGPDSVRAAIKRRAKEAGIEGRVSGHSLRIGSAQELAERGTSLAELQKEGRWKDPSMPALYIRNQEASRGAVARLRGGRRERGGAAKKSKKALAASRTVVVESG
ncbi:MAG: tyrosine-type recombinase/integrase [Gammaproteobacteria bacterium]|nr:tyrosine-type recombinase/integrase [Gammaproteobacteria bacterium]